MNTVDVDRDIVIPMRDGTRLVADVYRPVNDGDEAADRLSTILVRTSYDKTEGEMVSMNIDPHLFASHGYAVVIQDVRGRWKSDGDFYHGINETEDGADTLAWIAAQTWSNGKVGMTGISYLAAVQCAAALSGSPHLSSIFHVKAPFDYYRNGNRHGGHIAMYMLPITFFFASTSREAQADPILAESLLKAFEQGCDWLYRLPLKKGKNPLSATPGIEDWLLDIMSASEYGDFWRKVKLWQPCEYVDDYADVPGMYVSGWYDMYREPDIVEALMPRKRGPVRLIMGPWTHLSFDRVQGDVDFGAGSELSPDRYYELQLEWFDETLRDAPVSGKHPVHIFVMGGGDGTRSAEGNFNHGGHWRSEDAWPLARTVPTPLYLAPGSALVPAEPASDSEPTRYVHDPLHPVPTIGGVNYFLQPDPESIGARRTFVPHGPQDQRERLGAFGCSTDLPLSSRPDVLVFDTLPLTDDLEVTGSAEALLFFSSTAVDTDFVAKLVDVYPANADYPDGYALNVSEGTVRARYRHSFENPELLTPGEIYSVTIRLHPTSNVFKAGHRIRIQLASSDFPAYDPNPGTGGTIIAPQGLPVMNQVDVYHGPNITSRIVLPVIPAREPSEVDARP